MSGNDDDGAPPLPARLGPFAVRSRPVRVDAAAAAQGAFQAQRTDAAAEAASSGSAGGTARGTPSNAAPPARTPARSAAFAYPAAGFYAATTPHVQQQQQWSAGERGDLGTAGEGPRASGRVIPWAATGGKPGGAGSGRRGQGDAPRAVVKTPENPAVPAVTSEAAAARRWDADEANARRAAWFLHGGGEAARPPLPTPSATPGTKSTPLRAAAGSKRPIADVSKSGGANDGSSKAGKTRAATSPKTPVGVPRPAMSVTSRTPPVSKETGTLKAADIAMRRSMSLPSRTSGSKVLDGVTFSISGLQNPHRDELRRAAQALGAVYVHDLSELVPEGPPVAGPSRARPPPQQRQRRPQRRQLHLLLCPFDRTPKSNELVRLRVPGAVVAPAYVDECARARSRLGLDRFAKWVGGDGVNEALEAFATGGPQTNAVDPKTNAIDPITNAVDPMDETTDVDDDATDVDEEHQANVKRPRGEVASPPGEGSAASSAKRARDDHDIWADDLSDCLAGVVVCFDPGMPADTILLLQRYVAACGG
ncbi:hypothetical protein HK405_010752, partial [Cladochytrium tenue]